MLNKKIIRIGVIGVVFFVTLYINLWIEKETPRTLGMSDRTMLLHSPLPTPTQNPLNKEVINRVFKPELLKLRRGFGPTYQRTSDFLIGDVVVGIVLPESTGTASTENWTTIEKTTARSEIMEALNWWKTEANNRGIYLNFIIPEAVQVNTSYEPIKQIGLESPYGSAHLWLGDVMANLGYTTPSTHTDRILEYANDLRDAYNTNWAFIIFVVDGSTDADGYFAPGSWGIPGAVVTAWASRPGPHLVVNNRSGVGLGGPPEILNEVIAHEIGHVFGAADEVYVTGGGDCSPGKICTARYGYLGIQNQNCGATCRINIDCVMRAGNLLLCPYSAGQVGWWDSDDPDQNRGSPIYGDNIPNTLDTIPGVTLNPYLPDPTSDRTPNYTGIVWDIPTPPGSSQYISVTINTVKAQYQVDNGPWLAALPVDGAFDTPYEEFSFSPLLCKNRTYTIRARAINEVGNLSGIKSDTVSISSPFSCLYNYLPLVLKNYTPPVPPGSKPVFPLSPLPTPTLPTP